ncbi:gluconate:H+ symporter [Larkinella arboricola]|uniref:Gnt-I system high-affinity gluconate transporter n=1 Tax=Larkinella arboricola TaxID=643671 RepID=A0A327WTP0_LARAB|nr:gluconate:H+ symporter [Larkinella arboricola]RAJ95684.1 Gnt-I system high-affinity gluconate transporter [Larkinella arboricola]
MPLVLTFLGILALVFLIAFIKIDTFISFVLVSLAIGLAAGMDVVAIGKSIQTGIGGTLGELVLIVGFGAMLGRLVAESGAAMRITNVLIKVFGVKNLRWGLALAGFIIGIPLFYNAGFIIVFPLIITIAASSGLPMMTVAVPMLAALSVAHGYLPPHPSPAAIAGQLGANIGRTLVYGIIVSIPAIVIAGPIFGKTLTKYRPQIDHDLFKIRQIPDHELPGAGISFFVALLPVLLLTLTGPLKTVFPEGSFADKLITLLAEPYIGMLLSVLVAVYALGIQRGLTMKAVMKDLEEAIKAASPVLLVIAGAGALKQIFIDSGTSKYIGFLLQDVSISPLLLGWGIAAVIRVCVGSATVAGLTTVGIILPLIENQTNIKPELMVLAIGSGSLMMSHLNDGGFWLFKEYFNLSIRETLQTWTVMETIVSIIGLFGVLALNLVV